MVTQKREDQRELRDSCDRSTFVCDKANFDCSQCPEKERAEECRRQGLKTSDEIGPPRS